jgi:hypothetical protein
VLGFLPCPQIWCLRAQTTSTKAQVKYANGWSSRSRGRYAKMRADTRADTASYSWQAQKRGRYDGRYARYRDFQYLALSGEYLRICSCVFHWKTPVLAIICRVPMPSMSPHLNPQNSAESWRINTSKPWYLIITSGLKNIFCFYLHLQLSWWRHDNAT